MSKCQSARPLPGWLSAARDGREKRFVQVGDTLLFNDCFKALSPGAFKLYICCSMQAAGRIDFQMAASKAEQYGIPRTSFNRYMNELQKAKFVELVKSGRTTRTPNDYRFIFDWKKPP